MKSLEIGILKKYHKIYVSIQTNKTKLIDGNGKWNEHAEPSEERENRIFLLI